MANYELDLYTNHLSGGKSKFKDELNEISDKNYETLNSDDKKVLRLYKKRIIEQRNEIEKLKKEIASLKK